MKLKKKKNSIVSFFKRFTEPTPDKWKRIATTFGTLGTTFTAAFGAVKTLGIDTPSYFNMFVGGVVFVCYGITTYATQRVIPITKEEIKKDKDGAIQ